MSRQALVESIEHWERMYNDPNCGEEPIWRNCPCCLKYYQDSCVGCPVYGYTGKVACVGTPYGPAYEAFSRGHSVTFKVWARREINFLKEVLDNYV